MLGYTASHSGLWGNILATQLAPSLQQCTQILLPASSLPTPQLPLALPGSLKLDPCDCPLTSSPSFSQSYL